MKKIFKNNPYALITVVLSILLFCVNTIIIIFVLYNTTEKEFFSILGLIALYSFLCTLATLILNMLCAFVKNKLQKWKVFINIFSAIINLFIVEQQLSFLILTMVSSYAIINPNWDKPIINPAKYTEAKETISRSIYIKHFPETIPENASNIKFYKYNNWFGAEGMFLEFDADTKYIENNIQQHKCNYLSIPADLSQYRKLHTNMVIEFQDGFLDSKDYTFCILNPLKTNKKRFVPQYGIAIRKNNIIYYYNKKD